MMAHFPAVSSSGVLKEPSSATVALTAGWPVAWARPASRHGRGRTHVFGGHDHGRGVGRLPGPGSHRSRTTPPRSVGRGQLGASIVRNGTEMNSAGGLVRALAGIGISGVTSNWFRPRRNSTRPPSAVRCRRDLERGPDPASDGTVAGQGRAREDIIVVASSRSMTAVAGCVTEIVGAWRTAAAGPEVGPERDERRPSTARRRRGPARTSCPCAASRSVAGRR